MNYCSNKVSIVIPVFNLEPFLKKCLDSLKRQTYHNVEIILVDDGSTDRSVAIINDYLKEDDRFKLYAINHHGAASARKVGIQHASGPFITFVDGDDFLERDAIEVLLNEIVKNDVDIVIAKHRKVILNNSTATLQSDYPFQIIDQLSFSHFINQKKDFTLWGKIFKLELFEDVLFHEGIPLGEDALVLNQVILRAQKIKAINQIIYNYVIHSNSVSQKYYSKISYQLLYIKGSLDNLFIYGESKQYEELCLRFEDLLYYSKYYLKMNADEKKLYHSIWLNYYDKNIISKIILGNNFMGFNYWASSRSPRVYSLFQLGIIYSNLFLNKFINRVKNSYTYSKLLKF